MNKKVSTFIKNHLFSVCDIECEALEGIFSQADTFLKTADQGGEFHFSLNQEKVFTIFLEASTRTRLSFEVAAKNLGAQVFTVGDNVSLKKGESLEDTILTLIHLGATMIIVRSSYACESYITDELQDILNQKRVVFINAGDGANEHPSQALIDAYVLWRRKKTLAGHQAIFLGDVAHSRVAHSMIPLLQKNGSQVGVLESRKNKNMGGENTAYIRSFAHLKEAMVWGDLFFVIRMQKERYLQEEKMLSDDDYKKMYGLFSHHLEDIKEEALIFHAGPINRGIEIGDDVISDKKSVIWDEVREGVFLRMALLKYLCKRRVKETEKDKPYREKVKSNV